ncbi:MAG TPA: hypothetical protein VFR47_21545 [Anaerolineales bacterium]|nr:hypothetical protein [Anaerolineales bacterium]
MIQNRTNLVIGLLLIVLGGWLIATRQVPELQAWLEENFRWPMYTIGAGVLILLIGLLTGNPGMAVPASIVAGIGGILYYQELNNAYETWSYMWTLIPGFVGVGEILTGLLGDNTRHNLSRGLRKIVTSAVLFLVFATIFGGLELLGTYGAPIMIILLGLYILARGFTRRGGSGVPDETR